MKQVIQLMSILFISMSMSCKKKNQTPTEYFSFDADGVHYDYPQIKGATIGVGNWKTLSAGKSGTTAYKIYAYSNKAPTARGAFSFEFPEAHIPNQDTFIFNTNAYVYISRFQDQLIDYECTSPLSGKIIFSERSINKLTGTFEFDAYKVVTDPSTNITTVTDTILHITNGKFSIIP